MHPRSLIYSKDQIKSHPNRKSKINYNNTHLLNDVPATLESKIGKATISSTAPDIPASDIFDSILVKSSIKDVCLTFSAIAPTA